MVSILGTGLDIESLLGSIGETISTGLSNAGTYVSEKLNSIFATLIASIKSFLMWIADKIWYILQRLQEMALNLIRKYYELMMNDPMRGLRITGNLLILFG